MLLQGKFFEKFVENEVLRQCQVQHLTLFNIFCDNHPAIYDSIKAISRHVL